MMTVIVWSYSGQRHYDIALNHVWTGVTLTSLAEVWDYCNGNGIAIVQWMHE